MASTRASIPAGDALQTSLPRLPDGGLSSRPGLVPGPSRICSHSAWRSRVRSLRADPARPCPALLTWSIPNPLDVVRTGVARPPDAADQYDGCTGRCSASSALISTAPVQSSFAIFKAVHRFLLALSRRCLHSKVETPLPVWAMLCSVLLLRGFSHEGIILPVWRKHNSIHRVVFAWPECLYIWRPHNHVSSLSLLQIYRVVIPTYLR